MLVGYHPQPLRCYSPAGMMNELSSQRQFAGWHPEHPADRMAVRGPTAPRQRHCALQPQNSEYPSANHRFSTPA